MSGFLLDTYCVSELVRVRPEPRVLEWMQAADEALLYLSVLTLGEIRKGVARLVHSKRRTQLGTWLEVELHICFAGRVLPIDVGVTDRWGWLAATALHHNLTVVSRNASDFAGAQVPVVNPWEA